jgi:hypothetical protein
MDPVVSGRSNPYGVEGYKAIALELAAQLGEIPAAVIVPTASGDTLYGIAKGFAEISELTGEPMPRIVSAQPDQADPLARSLAAGRPVRVPMRTRWPCRSPTPAPDGTRSPPCSAGPAPPCRSRRRRSSTRCAGSPVTATWPSRPPPWPWPACGRCRPRTSPPPAGRSC